MTSPQSAMGWSAVFYYGIFWSNSPTFSFISLAISDKHHDAMMLHSTMTIKSLVYGILKVLDNDVL